MIVIKKISSPLYRICFRSVFCILAFFLVPFNVFSQNELLSLPDLAKKVQAQLFWDPLSGLASLQKDGYSASFRSNESIVFLNYSQIKILEPPIQKGSGLFVSSSFASTIEAFFTTQPPPVSYRVGAILIDAGHGGKDPGTSGTAIINGKKKTVLEKDVALTVSLELYALLKKQFPSKNIQMTRTSDTYPSLEDRVELANSISLAPHEAILYVSIHANSAFNTKARGFEVWYLTPEYRRTLIESTDEHTDVILPILNSMLEEEFTTESILIAKHILDGMEQQIGDKSPNRGIKEEAWFVVRNAKMPSVLIELGFLSNTEEATLLADSAYLKKSALGIYNGLATFISRFEGSGGFTQVQ